MSLRNLARRLYINTQTTLGFDKRAFARTYPSTSPRVRILLAHDTPKRTADGFRRQLDWASKHFDLIDFPRFKQLLNNPQQQQSRPAALFTFDDGFESNYDFAAPILEEFNTRGVFFVVPRFSLDTESPAAKAYFRQHLDGAGIADARPMRIDQITNLSRRGHTIGNHTFSHTRLSETPAADLPHEINDSADMLESWLGTPCETFAWTYAWDAIRPEPYHLITARHPYCFTPCPGVVRVGRDHQDSPQLLWRTNVEADASLSLCRFMYSGLVDPIWADRRTQLTQLLA